MTEEELDTLLRDTVSKSEGQIGQIVDDRSNRPQVWRVTSETVCKRVSPDSPHHEAYILDLVATQTSIPVPHLRRNPIRNIASGEHVLLMEYVDGTDLEIVWPTLSWWRRLSIVWTLRGYIQQLRRVSLPFPNVPGPFDGTGCPVHCTNGSLFDKPIGPFSSYASLAAWFEAKREITEESTGRIIPDRLDETRPLVLTHNDLHMRNVFLGKDGTVWLLDWADAGAYPDWVEYSSILKYASPCFDSPRSWTLMAPLIAGWFPKHQRFVERLRWALRHPYVE